MTKVSAISLAEELGGKTVQINDQNWQVMIRHSNGRVVVISDIALWEFADDQALRDGRADKTIPLEFTYYRLR